MTLPRRKPLIGDLRHRITHQRPIESQDDERETQEAWETLLTHSAEVTPLRGREFWLAQQVNSEVTHRILMRAGGVTVSTTDRFIFRGRKLNVLHVLDEDERGMYYNILAKEVA